MIDITAKYSRNDFVSFLADKFLPDDYEPSTSAVTIAGSGKIKKALSLGLCPSLDMSVYEFTHESRNDPRVTISREAFAFLKNNCTSSNALAVFVNEDTAQWRFSLITSGYTLSDNQTRVKRAFSNPRRYSYLLGEGCKRHTPELMLFAKGKVKSADDLVSRFAIDVVTKEFFTKLFAWYDKWAVKAVRFPVGYGKDAHLPKEINTVENQKHLIRLITRLIFVWFLRQKDSLIPAWVFDEGELAKVLNGFNPHSAKEGNYYNGIIQNLFFATLNNEIGRRTFYDNKNDKEGYGIKTFYRDHEDKPLFNISHEEFVRKFDSVPFLNGGLFECLDNFDTKEYYDGFSRESRRAAFVPNCLFFGDGKTDGQEGIIGLFSRYNFTVEENTPQDVDVALDPELLGKVFENLLGTYNEETSATARNESGSFYTPREIVDYMVTESLKAYLSEGEPGNVGILPTTDWKSAIPGNDKIDKLLDYAADTPEFTDAERKQLIDKIDACKIIDPACGSGAFPMGILHKLVHALHKLDPNNKLWKDKQIEKAQNIDDIEGRDKAIETIETAFEKNGLDYGRKLYLIENCIYGVDIQPIAIQISKLRFFISLMVDQKSNKNKDDNYGILPLPNLETKFVAANTLIGVENKDESVALFEDDEIESLQKALLRVRHLHFSAKTAKQKISLRNEDKRICGELIRLLHKNNYLANGDAKQAAEWNPYNQNQTADFFDPFWMFQLRTGFDVVIGNPPYVEHKKLKALSSLIKDDYTVYSGTADLSVYFIEEGMKLCKENGFLTFITTNKFFNTGYGRLVREFLLTYQIRQLINFEQVAVFERTLVSTVILGINKASRYSDGFIYHKFYNLNHNEFQKQFAEALSSKFNTYKQSLLNSEEWSFPDTAELALKEKIESGSQRISELEGVAVYRGVTTGYNPAFIIDDEAKAELIAADRKNSGIIKPLLQGRNIRKWVYNESNTYLLQTGYDIDIKRKYPSVFQRLKTFQKELSERDDKGENWWNLRACKYYHEFEKPEKIIWGLTADKWAFAYDDKQHYLPSNGYILTSSTIPVKYLLAILNSKLMKYYFGFIGVMTAGGAYTLKHTTIQQLPVKIARNQKPFIELVDKILAAKAKKPPADTTALEAEVDRLVYALYGLTEEEIKVVEGEE